MSGKSIIIIGAGLAGLSTGCYAQMNGYRTCIFEQHTVPGGVAAFWKRKGYSIDGGIHFLMYHKPGTKTYELYRELGTVQANRFLDMNTYCRYIDLNRGSSLEITRDLNSLENYSKTCLQSDAKTIEDLIKGVRVIQSDMAGDLLMEKPFELKGLSDLLKDIWKMRKTMKYYVGKYNKSIADYTSSLQDPMLRDVINNIFLPDVPVWFVMMILALLGDEHLGLIEGGTRSFVLPIEKRYRDLGGEITYKAMVEEILVQDDRAVGVRLADDSKHYADIIVSAADGYSTIFQMLGGRYVNNKIRKMYSDWKLMNPLVMINFGVTREFTDEPWMNLIKLKKPIIVGNKSINILLIRIFNYSTMFAPPGKTVVQVTFDSEWKWWNELRNDKSRYNEEKRRISVEVLGHLEKQYPGISGLVEMTDVATPYTTWRYTRNYKGAYEGWLPAPKIITARVEKTLPRLKNFYMAGQWVSPGGGVPLCIYSGRHVVQILCHSDGKPFITTIA